MSQGSATSDPIEGGLSTGARPALVDENDNEITAELPERFKVPKHCSQCN